MTNSFVLSTVTAILMTGSVLVILKNHHNDTENLHFNENETDLFDNENTFFKYIPNPKIASVVENIKIKRSSNYHSDDMMKYSIDDKNISMIDFPKREKIKEVSKHLLRM
jgi:hypothetical protein